MKRKISLRRWAGKAAAVYRQGWVLGKDHGMATLQLGVVLALVPSLVLSVFEAGDRAGILAVWEGWLHSLFEGGAPAERLSTLVLGTLQAWESRGLWTMLVSGVISLLANPLLGASQAMLYNGYAGEEATGLDVGREVARAVRPLMMTALLCMAIGWAVQMLPSVLSGLISAAAGFLSFLPVVGEAAAFLSAACSWILGAAGEAAASVLLCYVWISAACEGVGGTGALARSIALARGQMESTICAVAGLTLIRWILLILSGLLWAICFAVRQAPASILMYVDGAVSAAYSVALGMTASALYQGREVQGYGFHSGRPNISQMKSANL